MIAPAEIWPRVKDEALRRPWLASGIVVTLICLILMVTLDRPVALWAANGQDSDQRAFFESITDTGKAALFIYVGIALLIGARILFLQTLPHRIAYLYKRIADICLFTRGIFHDQSPLLESPSPRGRKDKNELENYGRYFYRAAAEYAELIERQSLSADGQQRLQEIVQILLQLSEHFAMAVKPLTFMADHYLEPFKEELFQK